MALTGAVYKWRLDNTSYAYITNETGGTPFIATNENNIDEGEIKEIVVSWDEQTYCAKFDDMVTMVHGYKDGKYNNLQFLDCSIYLNEFSDCPDEVLKPLIPTDIALTVEATPNIVQAEFIDEGTIYSDGEYLKQFKLKLNIPTEGGGVEYTAGQNISIENDIISAMGYRYDQDKVSIAVGSGSIGLGMWSHAEGYGTQANGEASHAEGYQTESRGNFTHTEGRETLAQGACGHAEGHETIASGVASHAEGAKYDNNRKTESAGQASHAEGASTYAKADGTHAEGILNIAGRFLNEISTAAQELGISGTQQELVAKLLGYGAHVEGMNNNALGSCSHSEGNATKALANATHAEGDTTIAFGEASHAEGYNTQAKGNQSHAEGSSTTATGNSAHAEGVSTVASGSFSHAEGSHTESKGRDSHAEGAYNKAIGIASHAEGAHTIAYGDYSHAEGEGTITNNVGEHAEGKYNHSNSDTEDTNNIGLNTIHSIGIGNDETDRKNAFEVMENGDVYVYNVGYYDGTNATDSAKTLQDVLRELNNGGGSGGSGITYVGGNNIEITGNTITAKGYTYDNETLEFSGNTLSLGGGYATIQYDVDERQTTFENTDGLYLIADGEMSITNISSNINITASEGDINISSNNNMNITASGQTINITSKNKFSVDSSSFSSTCPITAEVNGVENVYLGCPIGTVVMWVGQTAPNGWFLCNGDRILISGAIPIEQTIQGVSFQNGKLQSLVNILSGEFGAYAIIYIHRSSQYIAGATISGETITITGLTTDINLARKFYLDNNTQYTITDEQGTEFLDDDYTIYSVRELPNLQQKFPLGAQGGTTSIYSTNLGKTGGEDTHTLTPDEMPTHNHTFNVQSWGYSTAGNNRVLTNNNDNGTNEEISASTGYPSISNTGGGQSHNNIPPFLAINFIIKYK